MSVLLSTLRARTQAKLRDTDSKRPWFSTMEYDQTIADQFITISGRLPAPHLYTPSAFSILTDGTFDLPTGVEYAGDVRIQLVSTGLFLIKRNMEEMDGMRQGIPEGNGIPGNFVIWEEADKSIEGRAWPRPLTAELCNLYVSLMPEDLRAANLDVVMVDLSELACTALTLKVAGELVASSPAAKLEERGFNANVVGGWERDANRSLYQDEVRRHRLESQGRIQRFVS